MQQVNNFQGLLIGGMLVFFWLPVIVPLTYLTFRFAKWLWPWKEETEELPRID